MIEIPQEEVTESDKKFLTGKENKIIRYYFYLQNGLGILNEFRNLFLGIIAIYLTLKLDNYLYLIYMAIPSIIILTIIGYYSVHKVSKVKDWLNIRFGSHYGMQNFNYTKKQYELLEEIKELLKNGHR